MTEPTTQEKLHESMRLLAVGAWKAKEIVVGDMLHFCNTLEIKKVMPVAQANALTEICGIKVRESRLIPKNRASLFDETGRVIRIFEL